MPDTDPFQVLHDQLAARAAAGLRRELRQVEPGPTPWIDRDGPAGRQRLLHLCSNNYLGLANHSRVIAAAHHALDTHGAGAGASRLISGHLQPHAGLEAALAQLKHQPAALAFSTGYAANLGAITALAGPRDLILADALNHASLNDGCRLSGARVRHYRHADVDHLGDLLRLQSPRAGGRVLIVTDGVFSMDGDVAPLPELADAADEVGALLLVDDAHGTGVLGDHGSGAAEATGTANRVHVHIGTLSKALGGQGGFVAGPQVLIDWLIHAARPYVFTTGLAPASAAAARAAVEIVRSEPDRRERLRHNAQTLRHGLAELGYHLRPPGSTGIVTPIIAVHVGDATGALRLSAALESHGVLVPAVRPPTVPEGTSRLRVTVMSEHTDDDLRLALAAFAAAGRETGVLPA